MGVSDVDIVQARKDAEEMRVLVRKVLWATTRIQELLWQQEACLRVVEAQLFGGGGEVEVIDVDEDDEDEDEDEDDEDGEDGDDDKWSPAGAGQKRKHMGA